MPFRGRFVFKKAVSGEKKTFATISVVISSSSWLLRAMDPCRLLLDFKNRLFAPSKKNYHVQKRTIPSKISALRAFKKKLSASKKNSALRAEAFKKKFKKKLQPLRGWFRSKKTPKRSKKNSALRADVQKKLQNSFFLNGSVQKKTLVRCPSALVVRISKVRGRLCSGRLISPKAFCFVDFHTGFAISSMRNAVKTTRLKQKYNRSIIQLIREYRCLHR